MASSLFIRPDAQPEYTIGRRARQRARIRLCGLPWWQPRPAASISRRDHLVHRETDPDHPPFFGGKRQKKEDLPTILEIPHSFTRYWFTRLEPRPEAQAIDRLRIPGDAGCHTLLSFHKQCKSLQAHQHMRGCLFRRNVIVAADSAIKPPQ